jgi:hypothetical protein
MAQAQTEFRLRLQLERARSLPLAVPSRVFRVIGKQEVRAEQRVVQEG